jgi:hypothetical protein
MATIKALKIQQDNASKWDALSLVELHHREHSPKDMKYLKDKCSTNLKNLTLRYLNHKLA